MSAVNYMKLMQCARNKREQLHIKNVLTNLDFEISPIIETISHRASIFIEEYAIKPGLQFTNALVLQLEYSLCLCSANQKTL